LDNLWVPIPPVAADDEESAYNAPSAKVDREPFWADEVSLPSAPSGIESKMLATNDSL